MKLGFVISMYDEIDVVKETLLNLRKLGCSTVVIQSDPGDKQFVLDSTLCDEYEIMPDVSGSRQNYEKIVKEKTEGKGEMIGPIALTRNFNRAFILMKNFDVDYIVAITGDTKITNLNGISKIIKKMKMQKKIVAGTRTIGYTQYDETGKFARFQHKNIADIMPQFFIAEIDSVRSGLFCDTKRTNKYTTEQCFGDEIIRFCKEKNFQFLKKFYRISDYAYPRFIDGLHYNPEQLSKIPPSLEGLVNWIRYHNGKMINDVITKIFKIYENKQTKNE